MLTNVTRGYGLLEKFLAEMRAKKANSLINKAQRKGRILDIGSGSHPFFLLNTDFFEKFGVDQLISKKDQKKYIKNQIQLFQFDINAKKRLKFNDGYFDAVIMLAVAEHLREKELSSLLCEVYRVLKKGGCFIYTTPAPWTAISFKLLPYIGLVSRKEAEEHKAYYSSDKMKKILINAGFPGNKMKFGYFEILINTWGVAEK